jgi:hypothetical protein
MGRYSGAPGREDTISVSDGVVAGGHVERGREHVGPAPSW